MENQTIIPAAAGGIDRISGLPDEILHEVLRRLRSTKLAAKSTVLSRRWIDLWRSYPILEFDEDDFASSKPQSLSGFSAAVAEKFFQHSSAAVEAVRISTNGRQLMGNVVETLVGNLLKLEAAKASQQMEFSAVGNYHFIRSYCHHHFQFLDKILNLLLSGGSLHARNDVGFRSSLTKLHLFGVSISNKQILNDVIAGSPLLKTLKLFSVFWSGLDSSQVRMVVRDHPNLRVLYIMYSSKMNIEITGAHSLKTLVVLQANGGDELEIFSTQNLEVIDIHDSLYVEMSLASSSASTYT